MKKNIQLYWLIGIGLIVVLFWSQRAPSTTTGGWETPGDGGGAPSNPFSMTIALSKLPALDEEFLITATFRYHGGYMNQPMMANITLPGGIQLVDGPTTWTGNLTNENQSFAIIAKPIRTGVFDPIFASGELSSGGYTQHGGGGGPYYLSVHETYGEIVDNSYQRPQTQAECEQTPRFLWSSGQCIPLTEPIP